MGFHFVSAARLNMPARAVLWLVALLGLGLTAPQAARAENIPDLVVKNGQIDLADTEKYTGSVLCYDDEAAFTLPLPDGWVSDPATAARFGLCGLYYPEGYNFNDAPVVMYPKLYQAFPGNSLEERAQKQAEVTQREFLNLPGGQNLIVRKEKPYTNAAGRTFALRFFDNGPRPNVAEAAAYTIHKDSIFIVVLSATSAGQLPPYLPVLYATLGKVTAMNCTVEKP